MGFLTALGQSSTREDPAEVELRQRRLEAARKHGWLEIQEPVRRGPGWLVDVESDAVYTPKAGVVFTAGSVDISQGVDAFYIDRAGDVVPLERVTAVETWTEHVERRARREADRARA